MTLNNFNIEENNYFNQINNIEFEDNIYDDRNTPGIKYNVIFQNDQMKKTVLILNPNRTVDEMLTAYLKRIKNPELIGQNNKLLFLLNNNILSFGDQTPISNFTLSSIEIRVLGFKWTDI